MATRREQISEERREQILDGALKVFATKGFVHATNKDVAAAAGINSPGLIYHYFVDKADLLRAAIERHGPPMQLLAHSEQFMQLPVEEALTQFGLGYLRLADDPKVGASIRVLFAEAFHNPEFAKILAEVGPLRVWKLLADYLTHKMDDGTLRRADPRIAARCFVGPLVLEMLARKIFTLADNMSLDTHALVTTNVEIFMRGMKRED